MNLYIQIENDKPSNHPALEDNLIQAFGAVPDNWEPFVRVALPNPDVYEVLESQDPVYAKVNGVWTDVWALRSMTSEEIADKQQAVRDEWADQLDASNFATWVLDEETCTMIPPIPIPVEEGKMFQWFGSENSWKEISV